VEDLKEKLKAIEKRSRPVKRAKIEVDKE